MVKKKGDYLWKPIEPTASDIAGFIDMQIRQPGMLEDVQKILNAAQRVSRLWGSLPYGQPHFDKIEEELKNGPFDVYTIIGMLEVFRRNEREFWEEHWESVREFKGRIGAYRGHNSGPKQEFKTLVKECWIEWQRRIAQGNNPYPKGKIQFATDMLTKLEGDQKITPGRIAYTWCKEWDSEARAS